VGKSPLCSSTTPVTEWLFGDDLDQRLRTAQASARLVRGAGIRRGTPRFQPYPQQDRMARPNFGGASTSSSLNYGGSTPRYQGQRGQRAQLNPRTPNFRRH